MSSSESVPQKAGMSRIPFTAEAEGQIKSLSFWLRILGWLSILAGVANVFNIVLSSRNFGHIFNAILHVGMGTWCLQAAGAFKKVATTDVADLTYLVEGFSKLRNVFWLQGVLILIGLAFVTAVLLYFLFQGIDVR